MSTGDPTQIRQEIETTRAELGETVEALAAKTDVAAHAQRKLEETRTTVAEKRDDVVEKVRELTPESAAGAVTQATAAARENPLPVAAAGAFVAGFLLGRASRR